MPLTSNKNDHHWRFHRLGGFDQVRIETGQDICHLAELDQKLWAALSCPTKGVELDQHTLALLDIDGDGRIRVPEILAAVNWTCQVLKNPDDLLKGEGALPLAAIDSENEEGQQILRSARRILEYLGKGDGDAITAEETADTNKIFAATRFNGDGVVPPASAGEERLAKAIDEIISCVGRVPDRSGADGLSADLCQRFFEEARAYVEWYEEAEGDKQNLLPLGDGTEAAAQAFDAVQAKIDDFFTRTSLAAYDPLATAPLNPAEADYTAIALSELSASTATVAAFPVARVAADRALPLEKGVNPSWSGALEHFRTMVVAPLLGELDELTADQWCDICSRFAAHAAWIGRMRGASVQGLGIARVRELIGDGTEEKIADLIAEDEKLESEAGAIESVDRLIHYYQHLHTLLNNFVSLHEFYTPGKKAIFQAGTLYLDGRSCDLCVEVEDVAAHSTLATLSRAYLAYCECRRRGGSEKKTIVAAFTGGDADNLMVGRNGVFYDREGQDWDATIIRIIEHPISVSQAFWSPYKRVGRMISQQIEKFAGAHDKAVEEGTAKGVTELSTKAEAGKAEPVAPFDIAKFAGIFAAIGLAVGAIGTALAALATGFLALKWWQIPLAISGLLLVVSGPSVLLAYLKLRARNLGPILDANGWAVNTLAKINIPFGATLTGTARLPSGAERSLKDPFADKKRPWGLYLFLVFLLVVLVVLWRQGYVEQWWAKFGPATLVKSQQSTPAESSALGKGKAEAEGTQATPAQQVMSDQGAEGAKIEEIRQDKSASREHSGDESPNEAKDSDEESAKTERAGS